MFRTKICLLFLRNKPNELYLVIKCVLILRFVLRNKIRKVVALLFRLLLSTIVVRDCLKRADCLANKVPL